MDLLVGGNQDWDENHQIPQSSVGNGGGSRPLDKVVLAGDHLILLYCIKYVCKSLKVTLQFPKQSLLFEIMQHNVDLKPKYGEFHKICLVTPCCILK